MDLLLTLLLASPVFQLTASPRLALSDPGKGGAVVRFHAFIHGEETEEWYCPAIEWIWSDGTRSLRESDCPPWEEGYEGETSWIERRLLAPGLHRIEARLFKAGEVIARASVEVEVK